MTQVYHDKWDGYRYNVGQAMDWPRVWVPIWDVASSYGPAPNFILPTVVPQLVQYANAELALRAYSGGQLAADLDISEASVTVGPIKVQYDLNAPRYPIYRQVDMMLRQFFKRGGGNSVQLMRT